MSVMLFRPPTHPLALVSNHFRGRPCFYCGSELTSPFVEWMGVGEALVLHPACVVELSLRLLRDVHKIERATGCDVASRTFPEQLERVDQREGLR